jgi:hypothetical protein
VEELHRGADGGADEACEEDAGDPPCDLFFGAADGGDSKNEKNQGKGNERGEKHGSGSCPLVRCAGCVEVCGEDGRQVWITEAEQDAIGDTEQRGDDKCVPDARGILVLHGASLDDDACWCDWIHLEQELMVEGLVCCFGGLTCR